MRRRTIDNLLWFLGSLVLAFWIWFFATSANNPVSVRQFRAVPVKTLSDPAMFVDNASRIVTVFIRGPQSDLALIQQEDFVIEADLRGLPAGTHTVPVLMTISSAYRGIGSTSPTQLTYTIEPLVTQQKPVQIVVSKGPTTAYEYDAPVPVIKQAEVSGPQSQVAEVVAAIGELDLSDKRNPFETDLKLIPVDADGEVVANVMVIPVNTGVSVQVYRRTDVKEVAVNPNILDSTLTEGYTISTIHWDPQTVFISASSEELANIPDTISTAPIDLSGVTQDYLTSVPIKSPAVGVLLSTDTFVTVSISILPVNTTEQFDGVPVEVIGLRADQSVLVTPETVSVMISGSLTDIANVTKNDILVVVDVNGLEPGNHELMPNLIIKNGQIQLATSSVLPGKLTVVLLNETPTPDLTATSTLRPTASP